MKKASLQSIAELLDKKYPNTKQKKATKLWWNKYPYRLAFRIERGSNSRSWGAGPSLIAKHKLEKDLEEFQIKYNKFRIKFKDSVKTRSEWSFQQIYTTDLDAIAYFLKNFCSDVIQTIDEFKYFPDDVDFTTLKNIILCNHLPHNEFRFRVIFKHGKVDDGLKFIEWIEKYQKPDRRNPYYITEGVRRDIIRWGMSYNGYMYVRDDKHLHLLSFRAANVIKRIEEYKVRNETTIS